MARKLKLFYIIQYVKSVPYFLRATSRTNAMNILNSGYPTGKFRNRKIVIDDLEEVFEDEEGYYTLGFDNFSKNRFYVDPIILR